MNLIDLNREEEVSIVSMHRVCKSHQRESREHSSQTQTHLLIV